VTEGQRTALLVGAVGAVVAGGALILYPIIRAPGACAAPSGVPTIEPWPCTAGQAHQTLITLDKLWWEYWAANGRTTSSGYQSQLHAEAQAIRQAYPGSGPSGGYTCHELVRLGALPSNFPCPAVEATIDEMMKGAA